MLLRLSSIAMAAAGSILLNGCGNCDVHELTLLDDQKWTIDGWSIVDTDGGSHELVSDDTAEIVCADVCPTEDCELAFACDDDVCDPERGLGPVSVWVVCKHHYEASCR